MEDFTECLACAYHKRVNQHIYKENVPHVNKIDPRYSDSYCVDCLILIDEDHEEYDPNLMSRDEYLNKLFEERMAERHKPFEIWSQNPMCLSWYPMNDNATHWRCCTQKKNGILFQDLHINTASTPPPISRQETEVNNS